MLHKIRTQRLLGTNVNELTVSCIYSQSPTTVARVKRLVASVILCVCVFVCTIKPKRLKQKSSDLAHGKSIMSPRPQINIRSKGQRSRSQGHKVQKGYRVVGMSYNYSFISVS